MIKTIKIRDITFGELEEYVKKNCRYSNGRFNVKILGYNASSLECICGLPTNDARSIILQGDSDKVLEEEIEIGDESEVKYKELNNPLGFPLDIAFKALKEGIYAEEYGELEKYNVRGIELNGLGVISNICSYGDCDFTCLYKDYKKTWWLREDKSE